MWRWRQEKCTLNKYQAGCTTTLKLKLNLTFFKYQIDLSMWKACEILDHIFMRNVHMYFLACDPCFKYLVLFSVLFRIVILWVFVVQCAINWTISHFCCQVFERSCAIGWKSCAIGWTIFCRRCHLLPISSPVLHICQKCSCRKWFSLAILFLEIGSNAAGIYRRKMRLKIFEPNKKCFENMNTRTRKGFLQDFFSSKVAPSKPINTGPSPF